MPPNKTDHQAYDAIALQHALNAGESAEALKKVVQDLQRIIRGHAREITRSGDEVANAVAKAEQARDLVFQQELKVAEARAEKAQNHAAQAMAVAEANNEQATAFAARNTATDLSTDLPVATQARPRRRRRQHGSTYMPRSGCTLQCNRCDTRLSRNDEVRRHLRKVHYPTLFPGWERDALLAQARLDAP
ncbi:hypothetical protein LZ30DRAFT_757565 [Colletotrichum cereale]|nr:hypothetical protein LZ30DRAFT_757565 [Colletotrichum cereale]